MTWCMSLAIKNNQRFPVLSSCSVCNGLKVFRPLLVWIFWCLILYVSTIVLTQSCSSPCPCFEHSCRTPLNSGKLTAGAQLHSFEVGQMARLTAPLSRRTRTEKMLRLWGFFTEHRAVRAYIFAIMIKILLYYHYSKLHRVSLHVFPISHSFSEDSLNYVFSYYKPEIHTWLQLEL